jgi:hypothetical protein
VCARVILAPIVDIRAGLFRSRAGFDRGRLEGVDIEWVVMSTTIMPSWEP